MMTIDQARALRRTDRKPTLRQAIEMAIIDLDDFANPDGEFPPTSDALASLARDLRKALGETTY